MLAAAVAQFEDLWDDDADPETTRRRGHVAYYLEAAQLAVRDAMRAGDELDLHRGQRGAE